MKPGGLEFGRFSMPIRDGVIIADAASGPVLRGDRLADSPWRLTRRARPNFGPKV
jgi:hypothetical protein